MVQALLGEGRGEEVLSYHHAVPSAAGFRAEPELPEQGGDRRETGALW